MSAWLVGVGVGLYLGIVGAILVMARLEKRRIREEAEFQRRRFAFWQTFWSQQLAPRTRDADVVDALVGRETYGGPDVA